MNPLPIRSIHDMTEPTDHPEPILSAELQRVDDLIARYARRVRVPPAGLIDRVYEATVVRLPRSRHSPLLVPVLRASLWGRLALAASIGLVFVVASQHLRARRHLPLTPEEVLVLDWVDYTQLGLRPVTGQGDGDFENLLLTKDMTFDDLSSDLAMLAADLEM